MTQRTEEGVSIRAVRMRKISYRGRSGSSCCYKKLRCTKWMNSYSSIIVRSHRNRTRNIYICCRNSAAVFSHTSRNTLNNDPDGWGDDSSCNKSNGIKLTRKRETWLNVFSAYRQLYDSFSCKHSFFYSYIEICSSRTKSLISLQDLA